MKAASVSVAILSCLLLQGTSLAKEQADSADTTGFWHSTVAGSVYHMNDEGSPYRFSLGAGRPVYSQNLIFMADLVYTYYDINAIADKNPDPDIKGGTSSSLGFDLLLRLNVIPVKPVVLYLEGGGGFQSMLDSPPFPADGSYQNFTVFFGPGLQLPLTERTRLTLSLQWFHLSNAYIFSNNSGYDGIQLVLGTEWSL